MKYMNQIFPQFIVLIQTIILKQNQVPRNF